MKKMPCLSEIALAVGERTRLEFKDMADEEGGSLKRGRYYRAFYGIGGVRYEIYVCRYAVSPDEIIFLVRAGEDSGEGMEDFRQEICVEGFSCEEIALLIDGMWTCYRKLAIGWHKRRKQHMKEV